MSQLRFVPVLFATFFTSTCMQVEPAPANKVTSSQAAPASKNPLLAKWTGPYGGVPPLDQVKVEDFEGGVKLVYVVAERPFIRDILFAEVPA